MLSTLGVGLEQAFREMPHNITTFEQYEDWIDQIVGQYLVREEIERFNAFVSGSEYELKREHNAPPVLSQSDLVISQSDLDFWDENGYVIVRDAVPKSACEAAEQVLWDFLQMDKNDPATWYNQHPAKQGIMVQLFKHPALFATRRSERIRRAYEQLWHRTDLWVSTDRVGFNPPESQIWKFPGPRLHWDVSLDLPIPFGTQGILYLTDTQANQGALTLVTGFQNRVEKWLGSLPPNANPRAENRYALGATPIAANAGDLIIWHQALPHASSPNTASLPRIVQYSNWQPAKVEVREKWI